MIEATPEGDTLTQLAALLPEYLVNVRLSGIVSPFERSVVVGMIRNALEKGYTIDRTNSDGPLWEWDGWLEIIAPKASTFVQIASKGGGKLA